MYLFSKRITLVNSGILRGYTDYHSHILPGVDDGIQTMADALELLSWLERLDVKTVWLTPHIMEDIPNTTNDLRHKFQELLSSYSGPIRLHLAAEYMLDSLFMERFEADDLLPLKIEEAKSLLVEVSGFRSPMNFHQILERIKAKGYYPMLAHPERYLYMKDEEYGKLKELGVKFQLNLFSLVGGYGTLVEKRAKWLLKHGMYDISGTDVHKTEQLIKLQKMKIPVVVSNVLERMNSLD